MADQFGEERQTSVEGELLNTALSFVAVIVVAAVGTFLLSRTKLGSEVE